MEFVSVKRLFAGGNETAEGGQNTGADSNRTQIVWADMRGVCGNSGLVEQITFNTDIQIHNRVISTIEFDRLFRVKQKPISASDNERQFFFVSVLLF